MGYCDGHKIVCPKGYVGEIPTPSTFAGVAQLEERLICNQRVGGSSPSISSTPLKRDFNNHFFKEILQMKKIKVMSCALAMMATMSTAAPVFAADATNSMSAIKLTNGIVANREDTLSKHMGKITVECPDITEKNAVDELSKFKGLSNIDWSKISEQDITELLSKYMSEEQIEALKQFMEQVDIDWTQISKEDVAEMLAQYHELMNTDWANLSEQEIAEKLSQFMDKDAAEALAQLIAQADINWKTVSKEDIVEMMGKYAELAKIDWSALSQDEIAEKIKEFMAQSHITEITNAADAAKAIASITGKTDAEIKKIAKTDVVKNNMRLSGFTSGRNMYNWTIGVK